MGDFTMTCSLSGLGISGGTAVRCLLLTASPYGNDDPRHAWIVRTPPLRAVYNSYGSIQAIHQDDTFIAALWLRGLREDLINTVHGTPAAKDMSFDELLDALRAGRVVVHQDAKHFWRRPPLDEGDGLESQRELSLSLRTIEEVLSQDSILAASFPHPVSRSADEDKFVVDEPVPGLVRIRFCQGGEATLSALGDARAAIARAGFVGVVSAGSGRYANHAELVVLAAPNAAAHARGPQWDTASGQPADPGKQLPVAMAMIREDVWQALARYPHSETVTLDCTHCGQEPWYHEAERRCPHKSVNGKTFKKHPRATCYAHGPVFPDAVEHVVVQHSYGETVWYDLAAYKAGTRLTWKTILEHFAARASVTKGARENIKGIPPAVMGDPVIAGLLQSIKNAQQKELDRISRLSPQEREKSEADRRARVAAWEAQERDRLENPRFGDFLISDFVVRDSRQPGAWLFRDSVPGVIGVTEHLSMCLADKLEVPLPVLDAIAELSAINHVIAGVGVIWKPGAPTGPQYPAWSQHQRFARTVAAIVQTEYERDRQEEDDDTCATLDTCSALNEVQGRVKQQIV